MTSPVLYPLRSPVDGSEAPGPLERLMRDDALHVVFQPIASLRDGTIHAHEALIRGPQAMPLHSPEALFGAARREGIVERFELACLEIALNTWSALREPGRLFVNISANALVSSFRRRSVADLILSIDNLDLQPRMLPALAVVDAGRPLAIIERHQFLDRYAKSFFKEIYGRKPSLMFANTTPRLLEREQDISELIGILTSSDQRYLAEGFIVTENGRYFGLGSADQLVRNVTESRIEAARHANPLTFLPGNIPISEHIARLLNSGAAFIVCYADLSDFKPFKDRYGYWRGDEMIKVVATTTLAHTNPQRDLVSHVGGDDFVFVFQEAAWEARCREIIAAFNAAAIALYDEEAHRAGGILSEDRHGVSRFFPFATLYMGALAVVPGRFHDAEQVASAAAQAKQVAKVNGRAMVISDGISRESPRVGSSAEAIST